MTPLQILDTAGLAVLTLQAGWIVLLHRRLGSLRDTLGSANEVISHIDQAAQQLNDSSGGLVRKVKEGLAEMDTKLVACRSATQQLAVASREAEEASGRLEQALRASRKLNLARAAAPPREEVEPLGFAERMQARGEAAPEQFAQRILAAELAFAPTVSGDDVGRSPRPAPARSSVELEA